MNQRQVQELVEAHAKAAMALLPPLSDSLSRKHRDHAFDRDHAFWCMANGEWRQVVYYLENFAKADEFAANLVNEIHLASEHLRLYDRLGVKQALEQLNADDKAVLGECLHAAAAGPFFPDWEFHTLFGLERHEVARIADRWPNVADDDNADTAVNNACNMLWGYPHRKRVEWPKYISAPPEEVRRILSLWRKFTGKLRSGSSPSGAGL